MNDTEPSARDVAAFEHDLKHHKVRSMFYNKQASDKVVQQLVDIARAVQDSGGRRDRNRAARHELPGLDAEPAQRYRKGAGRPVFMNVVELDRATIGIGGRNVLAGRKLRHPRGRIHRRAGAERRRQDHADARHSRPAAAERGDACACSAAARSAATAPSAICRRCARCCRICACAGSISSAQSLNGERWGLPSLCRHDRRMIEETLEAVGARDLARRAAVRHVGRRTAAAFAGAGADRARRNCCCSTSR